MPTVNGGDYQHAVIDVNVLTAFAAPIALHTFTALSYKGTNEKKPVMDSQGQIINFTYDNQKIDASISMLRSEWVVARRSLVNAFAGQGFQGGALGILQVQFELDVTYGNSVLNYQTDKLLGVMFNEDAFDSKNDQNGLEVTLPLFVKKIVLDGTAPFVYRPY